MVLEKVSTEADKKLRDYELVLIISPRLSDEEAEVAINNVSRYITNGEGTITEIVKWGKRKLAYPIKDFTEANYVLVKFQLGPALDKGLEAQLRISEEILRHLLVRVGN
ncbi:MAG: 30S ribosomal protein S6 [Chloroflexi bacterium]|nr:30S ribosomal protein S6 [Chloroflexota bacterium]MBI2980680.1 30S ribosomal protein S6 [Chloroflexota bacterium]